MSVQTIKKVWGYEEILVNTELYCGKMLYLSKGYQCSIHYHKIKDETFHIIKGKILLELDSTKVTLEQGEAIRVAPGRHHRFTGIEDSAILEVSTHDSPEDSYRLTNSGRVE